MDLKVAWDEDVDEKTDENVLQWSGHTERMKNMLMRIRGLRSGGGSEVAEKLGCVLSQ